MVTAEDIAVTLDDSDAAVDPAAYFAEPGPVELEIGIGKGTFLLRQAKTHPERCYVGIEWANKFYRYSCDRMARHGVTNVRILRTDARAFVIRRMPEACLSALHVYHPDPWPKKRHHKRRLINEPFVAAAVRALRPGACWAIQTDHVGYFEQIREVTSAASGLEEIAFDEAVSGVVGEGAETNYELKYRREGRPIYRLAFRKRHD